MSRKLDLLIKHQTYFINNIDVIYDNLIDFKIKL